MLALAAATGFATLVLGRLAIGLAHTLGMVAGLTAVLRDHRSGSPSFRLNVFEFAGMLGVLGGLALVAAAPRSWGWSVSYLVASSPLLLVLAASRALWRRLGDSAAAAPAAASRRVGAPGPAAPPMPPVVAMMFAVGVVLGLAWSAASQFVIPLRGTREMGLDRAGVSSMLALAQVVDLAVLLPVGRLADRIGKGAVLGGVVLALGLGVIGIGVGSFTFFVLGCVGLGLGLAGWMLPLGVIREHTRLERLAWRTGLYRLAVDAAIFLGPLLSGALGERRAGVLVAGMGAGTVLVGLALLRREWPGSDARAGHDATPGGAPGWPRNAARLGTLAREPIEANQRAARRAAREETIDGEGPIHGRDHRTRVRAGPHRGIPGRGLRGDGGVPAGPRRGAPGRRALRGARCLRPLGSAPGDGPARHRGDRDSPGAPPCRSWNRRWPRALTSCARNPSPGTARRRGRWSRRRRGRGAWP